MQYVTEYVRHLETGESFSFEVSDEIINLIRRQQDQIRTGSNPMLGSLEDFTMNFECSLFPSFDEVVKIWFKNEYADQLARQILQEFGVSEEFIQILLTDKQFVGSVRPYFEGITCDGGRAARTIAVVCSQASQYLKTARHVIDCVQ